MKEFELLYPFKTRQEMWNHYFEYEEGYLFWRIRPANGVQIGDIAGHFSNKYIQVTLLGRYHCVHRVIYEMHYGDTLLEVDHIDTDIYNNLIENLRVATRKDNTRNVTKRKDNTTGYKGVHRSGNKYIAQTTSNGKRVYLGSYDTPEQAKEVYDTAARELHGEFFRG